jgi:hypothetical protein
VTVINKDGFIVSRLFWPTVNALAVVMMIRPEIEQTDTREVFTICDFVAFGYEVK